MQIVKAEFNNINVNATINKIVKQIEELAEFSKKVTGEPAKMPEWFRQDRPKPYAHLIQHAERLLELRNTMQSEIQEDLEALGNKLAAVIQQTNEFTSPRLANSDEIKKK